VRSIKVLIFAVVALSVSLFAQADTGHYYLMSYFKNLYLPDKDMAGGFFALSTDGTNWTELNNGGPTIIRSWIGEKLMRDPFIYFDQATMMFRLVYTTGWTMKGLGYMQIKVENGKDFKKFQDWEVLDADGHRQIAIGVSEKIPGATCTWAPEIFWDEIQNKYMIYWSTDAGAGKRAYCTLTSDFKTFSDPVKFFDPGYPEIDGDLFKEKDGLYYLFFKDERDSVTKLFYVTGPTPQGNPWSAVSAAMTTFSGVEGPSAIKIGNEYRLYFDPYAARASYRMIKSPDLVTWKDGGMIISKTINDNFYWSHCNVIEIPKNIYDWILTGTISVRWNLKPSAPKYATGTCFEVPGVYTIMGKKIRSPYAWSDDKAFKLPAGFFIAVDKKNRVASTIQKAR
jgi:hypothetical protein